jgi:hypothetical protein
MLTNRDRQILRFIETFGGITIYQCSKIYFKDSKHQYDLARKRLKILYDMNLIRYFTNKLTNERVYCDDKKITPHKTYLLDVYATLLTNNVKVLNLDFEPQWLDGKYRSDGFFLIEYNGTKRIMCVEVDITHMTKVEKYEEVYASGEIQKKYGAFPLIVIVGDIISEYKSKNFDVVYLDYKLNNFTEKVLAL